ncbi:MAG: hypothetical protein ABF379_11255, partial [Akkermansiaceae bacterium]
RSTVQSPGFEQIWSFVVGVACDAHSPQCEQHEEGAGSGSLVSEHLQSPRKISLTQRQYRKPG